jgi:acylphosphatase
MPTHYTIVISGKVQGVFYRASAKQKAEELGIKGFAQNLPNGNVLIEAEGEESQLKELISWCRQGPPNAHVSNAHVNGSTSRLRIIYDQTLNCQ